jgi:hypothetical protein
MQRIFKLGPPFANGLIEGGHYRSSATCLYVDWGVVVVSIDAVYVMDTVLG